MAAFERKLVVPIIGDARSFERAIKRSIKASNHFDSRMGRMAKGAAIGIAGVATAATGLSIALGVKAVKEAANFEDSMSRIVGLAGQSRKQVKKWSDQLLSLGPSLGKSPQELAEALYFIASSGVPASKAISVLTNSAKASAAGLGETQVVADAVTSVMNAYAASGMTAARATDTLVAIVREGKGEADAFAGVIGNIAAFSSRLKVPFEQMGAALAAMTQLGTDPHTAATQLQAFYSQILKVSAPMQKKAKTLGLGDIFGDLQNMLTRGNLLGALQRLRGLSPLQLAQIFPNVRAVRAALALVEQGGQRVIGVFRRMRNTSGSTEKAFTAQEQTANHAFKQLGAAMHTLKIAFGQGLLPVVKEFTLWLAKKLADPNVVATIRHIGVLVGQKLRTAFIAIGTWFQANWPQILAFLRAAEKHIQNISAGLHSLGKFLGKLGFLKAGSTNLQQKAVEEAFKMGGPAAAIALKRQQQGIADPTKKGLQVYGDVHVHGVKDEKDLVDKIVRGTKKKAPKTRGVRSPGLYHK